MNLTFYQKKEESDSGAVSMDVDIGAGKLLIPDRYQMMTGTIRLSLCVYVCKRESLCGVRECVRVLYVMMMIKI